ncbi:MAG: hypothetical protein COB53_06125 [Elusimicrobia bacterium]|nr:MAG: hypothetical protein COB53_06125 [Elusimicrobiota bacterium]
MSKQARITFAAAGAVFVLLLAVIGFRGVFTEAILPPLYAWEYFHRALDPRQPPSPHPVIKDNRPLHEQAAAMAASLKKDFLIEDEKLLLLSIPEAQLGDVCLWQGVYAAAAVFEWRLNPSPASRAQAEAAFDGLALLATRGNPIARAIYPIDLKTEPGGLQYHRAGRWQWKEDASIDSTAGWMFGVITVLRFLPSRRESAITLLRAYADALIKNGFRLENSDGTATRFHRVGGSWINSPVGVLTTLAALRALSSQPNGEIYARELASFKRARQDRWAAFASAPGLWRNATTNHNIAHLALAAALLVEDDPHSAGRYANGLARLGRLTLHEGNSFWTYLSIWALEDLVSRGTDLPPAADRWLRGKKAHFKRARPAMFEWNFPKNKQRRERLNSERSEIEWVRWPFGPKTPKRPIPVWQRPAADFVWQRPARSLDDWRDDKADAEIRFAPMDFLAAYRLGRIIGALQPQD